MSQVTISVQDLQAIQNLTGVIIPKIITRLKEAEEAVRTHSMQIADLQQQVQVLHDAAPKKERKPRGGKKKKEETPELAEPATVLPGDSAAGGYGDNHDAEFYGETATPAPTTPSAPPVNTVASIDGVAIDARLVGGVHYVLNQGFTDANVIAKTLNVPVSAVTHVLSMSIEEQHALQKQQA